MRANSGWLFGLVGLLGVGGGSWIPVTNFYDSFIESEQLKGYENARQDFRPKIDSLQQTLYRTQLDAARSMWELDMCRSASVPGAGSDSGSGGIAGDTTDFGGEWDFEGVP